MNVISASIGTTANGSWTNMEKDVDGVNRMDKYGFATINVHSQVRWRERRTPDGLRKAD